MTDVDTGMETTEPGDHQQLMIPDQDVVMRPVNLDRPKSLDELNAFCKEHNIIANEENPHKICPPFTLQIPDAPDDKTKTVVSRNVGTWRKPVIPQRILLKDIKTTQAERVASSPQKFLGAVWFNGGKRSTETYPIRTAAKELEEHLLSIVGDGTDLQVLVPEPSNTAYKVDSNRIKYCGPYILLVKVEDLDARKKLLGQQTFDFSPLLTFHIIEFSEQESWTIGIYDGENLPKNIDEAEAVVKWTFLSQIWEDPVFRRKVKECSKDNTEPTNLKVVRATRSLTVERLVLKTRTRWVLRMAPLFNNLEATEHVRRHLRSRTFACPDEDLEFVRLEPVKGQTANEPIMCTICKLDCHSAQSCTFAHADPPMEDWNGPTDQIDAMLTLFPRKGNNPGFTETRGGFNNRVRGTRGGRGRYMGPYNGRDRGRGSRY